MASKEGRGPSNWDMFVKKPGTIANNSTAKVSVDEDHRYIVVVAIMVKMNFNAYRFSISWSRIFPNGVGTVNWKGVAYYNRLIIYLLERGITPYAQLYHYDLPEALEKKYQGLFSQNVVKDFADFADFCFKTCGDRVKTWMTFNQPRVVAALGYDNGFFAPGRRSKAEKQYPIACIRDCVSVFREGIFRGMPGMIDKYFLLLFYFPIAKHSSSVHVHYPIGHLVFNPLDVLYAARPLFVKILQPGVTVGDKFLLGIQSRVEIILCMDCFSIDRTSSSEFVLDLIDKVGLNFLCLVMRDGDGKFHCFGLVNFENAAAAALAVEGLHGKHIDDKEWDFGKALKNSAREMGLKGDATVTAQAMQETFQVPFEMCVKEGDVSCVMCSYNSINGVPSCADNRLLSETVRGEWDLHGYIVADCDSLEVMHHGHKWLNDESEAAIVQTLDAGLDLDWGVYYTIYAYPTVQNGKVQETEVDKALRNLYVVLMRLGFFDGSPGGYDSLGKDDVCTKDHIELATQAAREGIVLLQNNHSLPSEDEFSKGDGIGGTVW